MRLLWNSLTRPQWDDFHRAHGGSLQQAWAYGEAMARLGVGVQRAAILLDQRLVGLAQCISRRWLGYVGLSTCARGPVWADDLEPSLRRAAIREMQRSIPVRPLRVTLLSPNAPANGPLAEELRGLHRVLTGYSTVMLDLRLDDAELHQRLHTNWRNKLAKAERQSGITISWGADGGRLADALRLENELRAQRHFHGLPTTFVCAYVQAHDQARQALLVGQAHQGRTLAASVLMLLHGRVATYHLGWTGEIGRRLHLHNQLIWQALPRLRERGITHLDLGGINTHQLEGISRFKICTGGEVLTLAGTYF